MKPRPCTLLAGIAALCVAACAASSAPSLGPPDELDHANPFVLNELAAAQVRRGDLDAAWLLLERAARLVPSDTRITRNLDLVRAARAGRATTASTLTPVPAPVHAAPPVQTPPAPLPALWPRS